MAVTLALVKTTPNSLQYAATQDGAAGTTVVLTNAVMVADSIAGPLRELLTTDTSPNAQAAQRAALLGDAGGIASQDLTNTPHATCKFTSRDTAVAYAVDADVDGVSALRGELNITAPAGASVAILEIQFNHTLTR